MEIEETKEKIVKELKGKKTFEIIYKFSDVIGECEFHTLKEAQEYADDNIPDEDTYCYEVEVVEQE